MLIALLVLSCVSRAHTRRPRAHEPHSQINTVVPFESENHRGSNFVTLESNGFDKKIGIKHGNLPGKELSFSTLSDNAGSIVATDIDRDGDVDLIWLGNTDRNNAVVLLNEGEGNFAEVSDNAPYASELDELFNTSDFPGQRSVQKRHRSSSLISSHFSDLGLAAEILFQASTTQQRGARAVASVADRLTILANVRKRGPPSILS